MKKKIHTALSREFINTLKKKAKRAVVTVILNGNVTDDCPQCIPNFTTEYAESIGADETEIAVNVTYDEQSSTTVVVLLVLNVYVNCDDTTPGIEYFFNTTCTSDSCENVSVSCEVSGFGKKKADKNDDNNNINIFLRQAVLNIYARSHCSSLPPHKLKKKRSHNTYVVATRKHHRQLCVI